jgi:hypothetical protein
MLLQTQYSHTRKNNVIQDNCEVVLTINLNSFNWLVESQTPFKQPRVSTTQAFDKAAVEKEYTRGGSER